jgi:hypothetical protein
VNAATHQPEPRVLPVDDILFDAWALTTVRDDLPGRPPIADWLHGIEETRLRRLTSSGERRWRYCGIRA